MIDDAYTEFISIYILVLFIYRQCVNQVWVVSWCWVTGYPLQIQGDCTSSFVLVHSVLLCRETRDSFPVWLMKQNKTAPFGEIIPKYFIYKTPNLDNRICLPFIAWTRPFWAVTWWGGKNPPQKNPGVCFHDIFHHQKKTCNTQVCSCQLCKRTVIDITGKTSQPFRGEAGLQRNLLIFCQKVTFSNLSKMADRTSWESVLFRQGGVESIVSPMYVINHVRVWILVGEIRIGWRSGRDLAAAFELCQNKIICILIILSEFQRTFEDGCRTNSHLGISTFV